jgi:25S rRNA (adenine2142-N1)-methyltransferase
MTADRNCFSTFFLPTNQTNKTFSHSYVLVNATGLTTSWFWVIFASKWRFYVPWSLGPLLTTPTLYVEVVWSHLTHISAASIIYFRDFSQDSYVVLKKYYIVYFRFYVSKYVFLEPAEGFVVIGRKSVTICSLNCISMLKAKDAVEVDNCNKPAIVESTCTCNDYGASLAPEPAQSSHQTLADYIKGVHAHLRLRVQDGEEADTVWSDHVTKEKEMRRNYAKSMLALATQHWSNESEEHGRQSRIDWTQKSVLEYFFGSCVHDEYDLLKSGLFTSACKDLRRELFEEGNLVKDPMSGKFMMGEDQAEMIKEAGKQKWKRTIGEDSKGYATKLKLLDVGSCFNPFKLFNQFQSLAVDISPASPCVTEMDFLTVPVVNEFSCEHTETKRQKCDTNDLIYLPVDHFHVIVFSLLLEYFPSAHQRWICCLKANRTLKTDGILVVITPDSSHVNKRALQMKSWKKALEIYLGFKRWKYEKLPHIHCMAFRKVKSVAKDVSDFSEVHGLLYIPQDSNQSPTLPVKMLTVT